MMLTGLIIQPIMNQQKTIQALMVLSLTPLFFALYLALHHYFDWNIMAGNNKHFAWLNSYIYTHYTAAFILALMSGLQLGTALNKANIQWPILLNIALLGLVWVSYHSFGDVQGVLLVFLCWLAATILDYNAIKNDLYPAWLARNKMQYNAIGLMLIGAVLTINR